MDRADIIISSTGAPNFIIGKALAEQIIHRRKNKPMFFIDIAVPRDIDPQLNDLDGVYLYDIDDLQHVVEENLRARESEAAQGETIIAREVEQMLGWLDEQEVVPAVIRLRKKAEAIRTEELAKLFSRLGPISETERMAIEAMASSIVNKLLHAPTVRVKQQSQSKSGAQHLQVLRELFGLDE